MVKSINFLEKQKLEILSEEWETKKSNTEMMLFQEIWFDKTGVSIIKIIKDFIMEKGLKLYGGLALHEHLKKYKEPLYNRHDFPDYDVFSPNSWEHAKELCDKLYKMGHNLVEAKGSTLNDEQHQTYKVSVDSFYIMDITQTGCSIEQLNDKDCEKCGETLDKKCISIFNHIPAYDITYNIKSKPKIYKETYNYDTNKAIFPKKLFLCDPEWLRISMYRELTEPLSNPLRLTKIGDRLNKFNKYFPHYIEECSVDEYKNIVNKDYKNILNFIGKFIKTKQLINYGASSYNLFVQNNKEDIGSLEIMNLDQIDNIEPDISLDIEELK